MATSAPPSTWCSPALPCTCSAASTKRIMPDAPIGLLESTPPDGFTGNEPVSSVAPLSVIFQPSPRSARSWPSSHIGSYHENGTYSSATSICWRGLVMPASL